MNILFIGEINQNDGGSKRMIPLLSHLLNHGHNIILVVKTVDDKYLYQVIPNAEIHAYEANYPPFISKFHKMKGIEKELFSSIKSLILSLKLTHNVNFIYSFNPHLHSGAIGLLCSKIFNKPHVLELSDMSWEWNTHVFPSKTNKMIMNLYSYLQKTIVKKADKIITTPFLKQYCISSLNIASKKIDVIPCGADYNIFKKSVYGLDIIKKYNMEGYIVIMYTGALYKAFGILDLIQAMKIVTTHHKNTKLMLVGKQLKNDMDEFLSKTKELQLENNIIFEEMQPYSQIPAFINAADICVNPFPDSPICRAGSPIKVFEYMLCAKPVIHSDLECIQDVIIDRLTGLLYEPNNIEDLAAKINYLIENPHLRIEIGNSAQKLILEKYTWDKLGNKLLESFTNI